MYLLNLVTQQGQTLAQYTLNAGSIRRIAAVDNVHYQLADAQDGFAAQGVQAGRAGDDLLVHINGEPALVIEDYFLLDGTGSKNPLLGLNGSGQYVAYPIGDASALAVEHLLAEEVAGVATTSAAAINPAIALATIGGVALTGAVIAGGSKNDGRSSDNSPQDQPQTPFDPNQPAPPVDNPPSGGGTTAPPPSGGGSNTPPPGGGNNPPPATTDTIPPALAIRAAQPSLKPGGSTQITFTLSEKVQGFEESDIVVNGGTLSNFSKVSDTIYAATFTAGTNPGNASLRVAGKAFKDAAGNDNQTPSELVLTIATTGNTAPDSKDKPVSLVEDGSYTFKATDFAFNDPDQGQTLKAVRIDSLPEKGMFTLNGAAVSAGQIVAAADLNKLAYKPVENGNGDNYARFTFSVQDSSGAFDENPNTITFNVTPVNDVPVAENDVKNTKAGEAITVNVLENDRDADGDSLTITNATLTNPAQGQVEIVGNQIRFTPAAGVSGDVEIRYSMSDGKGGSDDATLTVTVGPDTTPPELTIRAGNTNLEPNKSTQITFILSEKAEGFDVNDVQAEGGTLSGFAKVNDTTYTAIFTAGASPGSARVYVADDAFTDEADNPNKSADLTFVIGDAADKEPPTLVIKAEKTSLAPGQGTEITFELSEKVEGFEESDIEVQGGKLSNFAKTTETVYTATFTAGTNPGNASLRVAGKAFKDAVGNNNQEVSELALSITNTAPDSKDKPVSLVEDGSYTFKATDFAFNDPDQGQTLKTVRIDSLPEKGMLTLNGAAVSAGQIVAAADLNKLAYKPVENGNGDNYARFTFSVQDSAGAFDENPNTITFNVTPVNDVPVAENDVKNTKAGEAITVNVLENDSDADGDSLTITNATLTNPAQGQVEIVGNQIRFTPAAGVSGDIAIRYSVSDGKGGSDDATLTVTVGDELPPPTFTKGEDSDQGSVTITPHVTALSMEGSYEQKPGQSYRFKIFRSSENDPWQFDSGVSNKEMMLLDPESGAITLVAGVVMGGGEVKASNSRLSNTSEEINEIADTAPPGKYLVSIIGVGSVTEGLDAKYYVVLNKPVTEEVRINAKVKYVGSADAEDFKSEGITFKFAVGDKQIKPADLPTSLRFDRSSNKVTDPYEGDEHYKMELTFEGFSSPFSGTATTTSNWIPSQRHKFVETTIIDRLQYYEPTLQEDSGAVWIFAKKGADKLVIRYEDEQSRENEIVLINKDRENNLWEFAELPPEYVKLDANWVSLDAKAVKDGSTVTAWHSSSDGSKVGDEITQIAGSNPSPKILADALRSVHEGTDGDDVLVAPDIDPADYAALLATPDELLRQLDVEAENLLTQSAVDARHDFRGGAGNDIMISLNAADTLQGGAGKDSFIFVADGSASPAADQILDFHAGEDLIYLIGGQREINYSRFDENTQTLHYQSGQGGDTHSHSIVIHGHNGPLQEIEVLKTLNIL